MNCKAVLNSASYLELTVPFTASGYVACNGTAPLLELMRDEPAEQGPQMGGMA